MKKNYQKQLVLLGGGHANVQVLQKLCMNEYVGLHTILISDNYEATYSGMTPGFVKNDFLENEIQIDLQRLCFNAGATFVKDSIKSLDFKLNEIALIKNSNISFDILSINTGSVSKTNKILISNDAKYIFVKPINNLVKNLPKIDEVINNSIITNIAIVGGGISAYEISFSLKQRYQDKLKILIVGKSKLAEQNINRFTRNKIEDISRDMGIREVQGEVVSISRNNITLASGNVIESNFNIISTGSGTPNWVDKSFIEKDEDGFILVNEKLQSKSNNNIFVSGDIASIIDNFRVKSGVMAVRQGEILKENIFFKLQNKPLLSFKPQKNWLYIIGTYNQKAILNYYFFSFHGSWCWKLKTYIDKKFINRFKFPNKILMKKKHISIDYSDKIVHTMHCQGCGSKVSKKTLLKFIHKETNNNDLSDSSIIENKSLNILQSIDHIKLFESFNPYDFGIISYLHSQNDILASGGVVNSLSVSLGVPFSENKIEEFYLEFFMKGILNESKKYNSVIASGHSYQSIEPGIAITMNGSINLLAKKNQATKGDLIYLSKQLGSGYLLSAYFKNSPLLSIKDFQELIDWLKTGNYLASRAAQKNNCNVMTDISGFGLASHLGDICMSSNLSADIRLEKKLLINKNINLITSFQSTGFKNNYESSRDNVFFSGTNELENILYDPQTNGPMLMAINKKDQLKFENDFLKLNSRKPLLIGTFIEKSKKIINIKNSRNKY